MFLEWTDPPFAPGHWIPEMIEAAGGVPLLAKAGAKSERVLWEQVHESEPEVIVVAPCGFDLAGCQTLADELAATGVLPAGVPVHAVDANASWARPGHPARRRHRRAGRGVAPQVTRITRARIALDNTQ